MAKTVAKLPDRRAFLGWIAGSTLWGQTPGSPGGTQTTILSPAEALNVFDLAAAAQGKLTAAHWGFLVTGVDDDRTRDANESGFRQYQIRPRVFVDITQTDTSVEVLGERLASPIVLAPVASQRAFHADGELAAARAARAKRHHMILSCFASHHVQQVTKEFGAPVWFQLYPMDDWEVTRQVIGRAEEAGCQVVVFTADTPSGSNRETSTRAGRREHAVCQACHAPGLQGYLSRRPTYKGIDYSAVKSLFRPITWDFIDQVRRTTKMKIVIKGVMTGEDAEACVRQGIDGIVVSNHGGRELESYLGTIEVLEEVVQGAGGKLPVLIDGGFRRGTDVFKALALGARAICIGRPYLWGLAAFGQAGVERALELLQAELVRDMKLAGATSVREMTPAFVRRRAG